MEKRRLHILVSGRVQGVFFRDSTRRGAKKLGLRGFVRNLDDGRVEIVAEGKEAGLKKIAEWCKEGPVFARVEKVEMSLEKYKGDLKNFTIIYNE